MCGLFTLFAFAPSCNINGGVNGLLVLCSLKLSSHTDLICQLLTIFFYVHTSVSGLRIDSDAF